jgi:acyl transferase domain-containing protein
LSDCVRLLHAEGYRVLVEIGPHPVLLSIASRCLPDADLLCVPALRRDGDDVAMTAQGFAAVFVNGVDVWWRTLDGVPAEAPAIFAATPTAQRTDIIR